MGRGDANDLLAISSTINVWTSIRDRILLERQMELQRSLDLGSDWTSLDALVARLTDLSDLARTIDQASVRREYDNTPLSEEEDTTETARIGSVTSTILSTSGVQGGWTIKPE